MDGVVFAKTMFGMDELQRRQMRLHPRLRTLLVMVDGKKTGTQLVRSLAAAGITEAHLLELQDAGLIQAARTVGQAPTMSRSSPESLIGDAPSEASSDELERFMLLRDIFVTVIGETYATNGDTYMQKLDTVARMRDYILLGNEIITALNTSGRVEKAVAFKARIKPLLR